MKFMVIKQANIERELRSVGEIVELLPGSALYYRLAGAIQPVDQLITDEAVKQEVAARSASLLAQVADLTREIAMIKGALT